MFQVILVTFPKTHFLPLFFFRIWFFFFVPSSTFLSHLLLVIAHVSAPLPQAEQASLSHILDLLSLILLSAIWALCPRDSLALLGQWVQDKLSQVRSRVLLSEFI